MQVKIFDKMAQLVRNKHLTSNLQNGYNGYVIDEKSVGKNYQELARIVNEDGYISQGTVEELESLFKDPNYAIGIHRTGYTYVSEEFIQDVFGRGLYNNGHSMSGGFSDDINIEKTVSLFYDLPFLVHQLKAASGYKNSEGCFIVKIPKSYLAKQPGDVQPIYSKQDITPRLLPEFIYGFVPVDKNNVGEIIKNPNYKDQHFLYNENLVYDESVVYAAKRQGVDLKNVSKSGIEEQYNVLKKAYIETFNKYGSRQARGALFELFNNNPNYFTGLENKKYIIQHVLYGDIKKLLAYGSNLRNLNQVSINDLVDNFEQEINSLVVEEKKVNKF